MNKFWRNLHFLSTCLGGIFIFLASITGSILAIEPWFLSQNAVSGQTDSSLTLTAFQKKLAENFIEIFSIEKDAYGNLKVEGITLEKEGNLYVEAQSGKVISSPEELSPIFDWSRDLHRSLFLKTPGRILVGLGSLALVFLAISGIGLHIKRAGRFKAIFSSIKVLEIKRDGHALWSRLFLIPIFILAVSGVYLSAMRFFPNQAKTILVSEKIDFSNLLLKEVKKVNYPIMDNEPLVVELADKHLYYDKINGALIKTEILSITQRLHATNFLLHTGEGTKIWTGILLLTSFVMVFLTFTGFQMVANKLKLKKHKKSITEEAEIILLVGSETGNTWRFADALQEAFEANNLKVNLLGMENFPKIIGKKTLLFLTSTYGNGDAPENAQNFLYELEDKLSEAQKITFGVLGFGSRNYPEYCAFAEKLRFKLLKIKNTEELFPYMTVDNQSAAHFMEWVKVLNKNQNWFLKIDTNKLYPKRKKGLQSFKVIEKNEKEETFLLKISHSDKLKIQSGDLLAIYPPAENIERFYSIAKINTKELILVIKKTGICSTFLSSLKNGDSFEAYLKENSTFHFPEGNSPILMIANGTGIAPFLGKPFDKSLLFWGGKFESDFELFEPFVEKQNCRLAFSKEGNNYYVQDILKLEREDAINILKLNGTIMICGSTTMLKGVWQILEEIVSLNKDLPSLEELKTQKKILIDCY